MREFLCKSEHPAYPEHTQGERLPIEVTEIEEGQYWEESPQVNKILFLLKGDLSFSSGEVRDFNLRQGHMLFLRTGKKAGFKNNNKRVTVLTVSVFDKIQFCDTYLPEKVSKQINNNNSGFDKKPYLLSATPIIDNFLSLLTECHKAGLNSSGFNELKIKELSHMFHTFYTQEELFLFFRPALGPDFNFSRFILANYSKYRNVAEMASSMNYTVSGFEKKFKKVFKEAPYRWMLKQKAQEIYHCIAAGEMNFKEISDKFGFSSVSGLNNFIKQKYGRTPGEIRKNPNVGGN